MIHRVVHPLLLQFCRTLLPVLVLGICTGCASLQPNVARVPSTAEALDPTSPLGKMVGEVVPPGDKSGFSLMPVSSVAFETRVALARTAQHTVDVQYYIFHNDDTGLALMRELRDAAIRGVRVRILIDDLYAGGEDTVLSDLATYPNVQIRLFNPFVYGRAGLYSRLVMAAADSTRVNHRMHNKLFIVDGAAAVSGGRNIADEYFMTSPESNFIDVDIFMAGPVVTQLEGIFDIYWNSRYAYPLATIVPAAPDRIAAQAEFTATTGRAFGPPHEDLSEDFQIFGGLPTQIAEGHLKPLVLAHAEAFADPIEKAGGADENTLEGTVTARVIKAMVGAHENVTIASPYFVPGDSGVALMKKGVDHGGRVTVITNSLASTDEPAVHASYAAYRRAMLEAGIDLRELSPTLSNSRHRMGDFGKSTGSLHAKVVTIDDKLLYLGSMNFDPRSAHHNTELGILIESPTLTVQIRNLMDDRSLYRLRLSPGGTIQWVADTADREVVYDEEPEASLWLRTYAWLLSIIVPTSEV